jgi:hypothetical protein
MLNTTALRSSELQPKATGRTPVSAIWGCRSLIGRTIHLLVAAVLAAVSPVTGQKASRSISLRAYLRSTVHLSDDSIAIYFRVANGSCQDISLPFDISWNLDRFAQQIQLIASFDNSGAALSDRQGHTIDSSGVEARIGDSAWKTFPGIRTHVLPSGILLSTIDVSEFGRQAHQHTKLHFRLCGDQAPLSEGEYHGRVALHAIIR